MNKNERAALIAMHKGYELLIGRGIFQMHCMLIGKNDRMPVHRQTLARLRNSGLIEYIPNQPERGRLSKTGATVAKRLANR